MATPLFRDMRPEFMKAASGTPTLSPSTRNWPREILQEAYRQVPALQDLAVRLEMRRVDEIRGFGLGSLMLKEASLGGEVPQQADAPPVAIPVTVRDRRLDPLDVLMVGPQIYPLTDDRLADLFHNNSVFSRVRQPKTEMPAGDSLQRLTAPQDGSRSGLNLAGISGFGSNLSKVSSELLPLAARTADPEDHAALRAAVAGLHGTPAFSEAVGLVLETEPLTADQVKQAAEQSEVVDVLEVCPAPGGRYRIRAVRRDFYKEASPRYADRIEVESLIGAERLAQLEEQGRLIATRPVEGVGRIEPAPMGIPNTAGIYKLASDQGAERAVVIPRPLDLRRGVRHDGFLVVGSKGYQHQQDVGVTEFVSLNLQPSDPSAGEVGTFLWKEGSEVFGTLPVQIRSEVVEPDGRSYYAEPVNDSGSGFRVYLGNLKTGAPASDGFVLPKTAAFVRVGPRLPSDFWTREKALQVKVAQVGERAVVVEHFGGENYLLRGKPVERWDQPMTRDAAVLMLAALGHPTPTEVLDHSKVASQLFQTPVKLRAAEDVVKEAQEAAEVAHRDFPKEWRFSPEVVKLAAMLPSDRPTVDTVLALNFLNPDNLRILRGYLPEIEKTASRLAEVLVATRMGLRGDPEPVRLAMQYVRRAADQLRSSIIAG